jgi:hypothetical protein
VFCGFNPLKDYALDELARCAGTPLLRHGIKLHFGNSNVQLGWAAFRRLPLTEEEFARIAANVAPYMR